jgi:hypothetical protein
MLDHIEMVQVGQAKWPPPAEWWPHTPPTSCGKMQSYEQDQLWSSDYLARCHSGLGWRTSRIGCQQKCVVKQGPRI